MSEGKFKPYCLICDKTMIMVAVYNGLRNETIEVYQCKGCGRAQIETIWIKEHRIKISRRIG